MAYEFFQSFQFELSDFDVFADTRSQVYRGVTAERAADSFFRTGNLIALRELALRHVTERARNRVRPRLCAR